jgi:hypothetical protein
MGFSTISLNRGYRQSRLVHLSPRSGVNARSEEAKGHRLHYMDDESLVAAVEGVAKAPIPDPTKSTPGTPL